MEKYVIAVHANNLVFKEFKEEACADYKEFDTLEEAEKEMQLIDSSDAHLNDVKGFAKMQFPEATHLYVSLFKDKYEYDECVESDLLDIIGIYDYCEGV